MSSISNFLQDALQIDSQESSAENNYKYEKEQLKGMYDEQAQQLKDSAIQALPFGIAEATRGIGNLYSSGKAIYAFSQKYSPQIEAFAAKASKAYDNIGKEGGEAVDYADLLKSAGTKLGAKALELAAPKVLARTGIDITKSSKLAQGEGGLEAGLADLKQQAVNVGRTQVAGAVEEAATRVRGVAATAAARVNNVVEQGQAAVGAGVERATNPNLRIEAGGVEIRNPLFTAEEDGALTAHGSKITSALGGAATDAVKSAAAKAAASIDQFKAASADVAGRLSETTSKLVAAQAKVKEIQARGPEISGLRSGESMYPAIRGRAPVVNTSSSELEAAKAEVATHTQSLENITKESEGLRTNFANSLEDTRAAASSFASRAAGTAFEAGKTALGVGGEALGIYGAVGAARDLASGNVSVQGGVNDTIGLYFGGRSAQGLVGRGSQLVDKLRGNVEGGIKAGGEKVAEEGGIKVGSAATDTAEAGAKDAIEAAAKDVAIKTGEKVGIGLAETGAEIGAAAAGASVIPVVGEAVDIGLGLYTAISSLIDIFKKPPAPPPPPPVQQQAIAITHQQGVY